MAKLGWSPWSDLPSELLHVIFHKLENPSDIYQCGIVCDSWKSVATAILSYFIFLPVNYSRVGDCVLFNTQTKGIHTITLPELNRVWVLSSSFGWLLTIRFNNWPDKICLLNPITREQIKLPFTRIVFERIHDLRVITSTSPLDPECLVIVESRKFYSSKLISVFYCRPGDSDWKVIEIDNWNSIDVIFHKGELYSVDVYGKLYLIDVFRRCFNHIVVESSIPQLESRTWIVNSLVEVEGSLLLVAISFYSDTHEVYKLDWIEKRNLEPNTKSIQPRTKIEPPPNPPNSRHRIQYRPTKSSPSNPAPPNQEEVLV
ncbi:hypothetical protein Ddye_027626 [Dipteronia dyeriana]|uniref:F-box domain-containing protein n=1 Tax=Dipteronia dyeriana TaxID=168575 RepID=A0AAD9TQ45_9ROSI|nr:hypothetical protein Ddye_027626 [Dipteronia dyeriana]